jgi:hypothetical protein
MAVAVRHATFAASLPVLSSGLSRSPAQPMRLAPTTDECE